MFVNDWIICYKRSLMLIAYILLFPKLAVASVTILLLWSNMYVVGKLDDSNIDKENGITSVGEDIKSYWAVWEPCRLIRCGV